MWQNILHWKTLILRYCARMDQTEMVFLMVLLLVVGVYCMKGTNRRLGI